MTNLVITKERWDKLLFVAEKALNGSIYAIEEDLWEFSTEERMLLIAVLKNNTPFNVVENIMFDFNKVKVIGVTQPVVDVL